MTTKLIPDASNVKAPIVVQKQPLFLVANKLGITISSVQSFPEPNWTNVSFRSQGHAHSMFQSAIQHLIGFRPSHIGAKLSLVAMQFH